MRGSNALIWLPVYFPHPFDASPFAIHRLYGNVCFTDQGTSEIDTCMELGLVSIEKMTNRTGWIAKAVNSPFASRAFRSSCMSILNRLYPGGVPKRQLFGVILHRFGTDHLSLADSMRGRAIAVLGRLNDLGCKFEA
jgi:hypothetical protein